MQLDYCFQTITLNFYHLLFTAESAHIYCRYDPLVSFFVFVWSQMLVKGKISTWYSTMVLKRMATMHSI